jgi:hypothetical protein
MKMYNENIRPDDLEKKILDNLDDINSFEPTAGHFLRFEEKLKSNPKVMHFNWQAVWKVAAAVVFIFLAVNQARLWFIPNEKTPATLAGISPEYAEIEYFYTSSIRSGMQAWENLADSGLVSEEENQMMQQEFREFEKKFEEIQAEFEANPYDERVINALLEHYQAKLNVINMIISKLQEVKQQKSISHETEV